MMKTKLKRFKLSLTLLLCCFFFGITSVDAVEVLSLIKKNRGLFGYRDVSWYQAPGGMIGSCEEPGFSNCKNPNGINSPDPVTDEYINTLVRFADLKIANGSRSGSETRLVQVQGESQVRRYIATWVATDVIDRPSDDGEHGDGQEMTITINLEFINP